MLSALKNQALKNIDNKVKVAAAGANPPLIQLLGSPSAAVQQRVVHALKSLADNTDNKREIGHMGAYNNALMK